jgi:ABC-2 type transport system ATP-binding protein
VTAPVVFDDAGKRFGDTWVVEGLDIEVDPGTIFGLIGPSGCGKTTTMRMANGVYRPDAGRVEVLGSRPSELAAGDRTSIGYLPQSPVLFQELSLWENLNFHASLNGVPIRRKSRLRELLELVELEGDERKLVREASGGMLRRLALAATLVHQPAVLMLDEPTAGIDPILRRRFWDHFRSLCADGRTILVNTQYVGEAADCDLVGLLAAGRLVALGTPEELRRKAFGGDVLKVVLETDPDDSTISAIRALNEVRECTLVEPRHLRLVVKDGGAALPLVMALLEEHALGIVDSEEMIGSYDDVFIILVEAAEQGGRVVEDPGLSSTDPDPTRPASPTPSEN